MANLKMPWWKPVTMPFKPFVSAPLTTLSEISVTAAKRAFELAVLTYRRLDITLIPRHY